LPYTLGIDVGASRAAAAITRLDGPHRGAPHPVSPVSADPGPFVGRIGDDVPIVLGNRQHNAHELMATGIDRIVEQVAAHHGDRPVRVTVTVLFWPSPALSYVPEAFVTITDSPSTTLPTA